MTYITAEAADVGLKPGAARALVLLGRPPPHLLSFRTLRKPDRIVPGAGAKFQAGSPAGARRTWEESRAEAL